MHLAKTVNTVSACKEALWAEYKQLFPGDLPPIISNTLRPNARHRALKHSPREAFETDWTSWEQCVSLPLLISSWSNALTPLTVTWPTECRCVDASLRNSAGQSQSRYLTCRSGETGCPRTAAGR
jgi:hypothetical protein